MTQPFLRFVSRLYGSAALARRRWYAARPSARRRLARPVVSVGNLSVGGSGKTPVVAAVARQLLARGERPAILSRGYARRRVRDGAVVVRDASALRAGVDEAGDEPFMLARALPGVAVLVCADRYVAGRLAETRLGCTVHVLDDGFQHVELERDVNLLVVAPQDLDCPYPLPLGRLREPVTAAAAADAVLVSALPVEAAGGLGTGPVFALQRAIGRPCPVPLEAAGRPAAVAPPAPPGPVFAMAAIARPERFVEDLRRDGWALAGTRTFRDHHWFSAGDLAAVEDAARAAGARAILTTEKDMVRLPNPEPRTPHPGPRVPMFWVPLQVTLDPAFAPWLQARLAEARVVD